MNRIIKILLAFIIMLCSVTSCNWQMDPDGTTKNSEPFFLQWKVDNNGSSLSLEGPSRVLPGEEVTFVLGMNNMAQSNWTGNYCLLLVRQPTEVEQLLYGKYSIQPGSGQEFELNSQIPSDLAEDAYGLALVIPGNLPSVTMIHVGKSTDPRAVPWPEPHCIDQ